MLKALILILLPAACFCQSLDQSPVLFQRRAGLTSEFSKLNSDLRSAKSDAAAKAVGQRLVDFCARLDGLRSDIEKANIPILERLSPYSSSATVKAACQKLKDADSSLAGLEIPAGPQFSPQDMNKIQLVLDGMKKVIELHKHAASNVRR